MSAVVATFHLPAALRYGRENMVDGTMLIILTVIFKCQFYFTINTIIYFHLGERSLEDFRRQKADVGDEMFA